jgi:hypothetical protein
MDAQPIPLPPEISRLIAANGGVPPLVEDPETEQVYRLIEAQPSDLNLDEEYIRQEVEKGIADIEAGRIKPWNIDEFLVEAHRRHSEANKR